MYVYRIYSVVIKLILCNLLQLFFLFQTKTSAQLKEEKRAVIDAQSVFAKLKPKKVSQTAKKAFARQSLQDIVTQSPKNFSNVKNLNQGPPSLGIIQKKTGPQDPSLKISKSPGGTDTADCKSDSSYCENNSTRQNAFSAASNNHDIEPTTSSHLHITTHLVNHNSFVLDKGESSDKIVNSETQASTISQESGTPCSNNSKCLVTYDLSTSDSDSSCH